MDNQNQDLQIKVEKLEEEVREMKKQIEFLLITKETSNEIKQMTQTKVNNPKPQKTVSRQVKVTVENEKVDYEALIFQKWLPRFFIFIFILGVMWGFKAASDYGVLNKYAKVGIGFVIAFALFWYGNRQMKAKRSTLGQSLIGGVLPVLFLTTFAMHHLYHMAGSTIAFSLLIIWVSIGFYSMNRYKSEVIGLISIIGAVFVPFLVKSDSPNYLFFSIYETVIYLCFMFYATFKKYKFIYLSSVILLHLSYLIVALVNFNTNGIEYFALSILVQHISLLVILIKSKFAIKKLVIILHTSFILTIGWIFSAFEDQTRTMILIFLCVGYLFLTFYYKKKSDFFFGFSTNFILAISFLCLDSVSENLLCTVLIIQAVSTYLFYLRYRDLLKLIIATLTFIPVGISILSVGIDSFWSFETMNWLVLILALITIAILAYKNEDEKQFILLSSSLLITVILIAFITQIVQILAVDQSDNIIRLLINISWILLSILAMILGNIKKFKVWTYTGIGLLLLTLGKLVLIDLPNITLMVRAGLFILLGLIGLVISRIFFKGSSSQKNYKI
ncbi:DUF2339 domain-containing protein [Gottfriedia acidiceleris]|uniref:DUF2339 domain-containing protein n=1 Tax=Gottfriedia acidiceleris TaxID=371036 RepID=A0ABY4JMY1_9BACI|nr:DUF2339 domain-containing protein [Gottfriedia acidiceleris]UPM55196.1 DUF2339 domain-containing protein [Gottfriedia acidiceleris]